MIYLNLKYIKNYFADIAEEIVIEPNDTVRDEGLHGIIELYIKVWCFSTTKDYAQKHWLKKSTKNIALKSVNINQKGNVADNKFYILLIYNFRES